MYTARMNTHIIPAIMPQQFEDIEINVSMVKRHVPMVQLDLMDGKYVPEKTWPFYYGTDYNLESLRKQDIAFPFWEDMNYELDLMVARPEEMLGTWLAVGASRIIFHYGSVHDWQKIKDIEIGLRNFTQIGLAVTIHDDLEDVYKLIEEKVVDFVQVMGIAQIGYMGEPFEPQSLEIILKLKAKYPDLTITVDGGVSYETVPELASAGATRFVSGSGVFGGGMAKENIYELEQLTIIEE